jgi:hypothetical protein
MTSFDLYRCINIKQTHINYRALATDSRAIVYTGCRV